MSDVSDSSLEKSRFDTQSFHYMCPIDPYNDRLVQFTVLKQMGYPVDLQPVQAEDFPEDYFTRNESEWERDNYPVWLRPLVHVQEFERYIDDPDVPGDCITSEDEELNKQLGDHPMQLVSLVDMADVHMLAYDIDCFDNNETTFLDDGGTGLLTRGLLVGCFMAALERYTDRKARGYQHWHDKGRSAVTVDDFVRHKAYELQGYRAASPEQLGALMIDYYRLAEIARPEILEFKGPETLVTGI